jgi:para-aminobenzoate synthetase component 1
MQEIKKLLKPTSSVHVEPLELKESFLNLGARFASQPGTAVLLSGSELDCSRYNILATWPWLQISGQSQEMNLSVIDDRIKFQADPFETLKTILDSCRLEDFTPSLPVGAGLFGYLAYDLKDQLENLPRTSIDDLSLPHLYFFSPSIIIVQDRLAGQTRLCIPIQKDQGEQYIKYIRQEFFSALDKQNTDSQFLGNQGLFESNFTQSAYEQAIERIREYIASGHVYQVNMSQRFSTDFEGDSYQLFSNLFQRNPAPFFAYIQAGDHQIISTSPERFLSRNSLEVETRPIKGTRPRGKTSEEDQNNKLELLHSKKDDAELSMIVDLLRNDLGKVCQAGSVRVSEHKKLEEYQNVFHLVSIVKGRLAGGKDTVDLLRATFPGGSITGCPKVRAMEIIDELEPSRRHVYTGSIGYLSFHDTLDLSIAIRTITIHKGQYIFSVGGGVVYDSDPAAEFEETMHKGQTMLSVLNSPLQSLKDPKQVWINGRFEAEDKAKISIFDLGLQYGYGFFETIRADKGKPEFLAEHIERFSKAWKHFFSLAPPDLSWSEIIRLLLERNDLLEGTAAVKILATKGQPGKKPAHPTIAITAKPYTHRLAHSQKTGLKLLTYPEPRQTPLAEHKTLNYLYYYLAGTWAKQNGADEALILNPDGTISETNTGNLIFIQDQKAIIPSSEHVLPGVMQDKVLQILSSLGYYLERQNFKMQDLYKAKYAILTNSLLGAVPIIAVDNIPFPATTNLTNHINNINIRT